MKQPDKRKRRSPGSPRIPLPPKRPRPAKQSRTLTGAWRKPFLAHLAASGNITGSARAAGVDRNTAKLHREKDAKFARAWDQAMEEANDAVEAELRRRAMEGVAEPVVHAGQLCFHPVDKDGNFLPPTMPDGTPILPGTPDPRVAGLLPLVVRKYSDGLLMFLAKATNPKFRDKVHVTGDPPAEEALVLVHSAPPGARAAYLARQQQQQGGGGGEP